MPYAAKGTRIQVDAGADDKFIDIAEVVSVSGPTITNEVIDATNLLDSWRTFISAGVTDSGDVTLELNLEPDDTRHIALIDIVRTGASYEYALVWSNYTANSQAVNAINAGTDTITMVAAHGLHTGQPVQMTTDDTLPTNISALTTYYVIVVDADELQLATTNANAVAGTQIDIDAGVGNHTVESGSKVLFDATVTDVEPSGSESGKLSGNITFKISDGLTVTS